MIECKIDGNIAVITLNNPAANTFTALTATLMTARFFHAATLLPNGRVLLTGGGSDLTGPALDTAEFF